MRRRGVAALGALMLALMLALLPGGAVPGQGAPPVPGDARGRTVPEEVVALRRERQALEAQMGLLQRTATSLTDELANLEAQRAATARLLETLDRQMADIGVLVLRAERSLRRAEGELAAKRETLHRRIAAVYKRGQLHPVEVLLSAQSFAGLVARYKYLHDAAAHDRELVRGVERLRAGAARQRRALEGLRLDVQRTRAEKEREVQRLAELEGHRARSLAAVATSTERARARLVRLGGGDGPVPAGPAGDEGGGARPAATAPAGAVRPPAESLRASSGGAARGSALAAADRGRLEWPVTGGLLYSFGRSPGRPDIPVRWNGVGIRAPVGTPVRVVADGEVAVAGPVSTYGPTVIVQHGDGDYTVYGSLGQLSVRRGQSVARGEVIGTVGASDPALPAHLHFELRPKGRAVDPLPWLRRTAGAPD
ncbi:MAG: peptidoglycan DD-metalloendopeptidase family protein [Gemmatimonadetes bacterium]|nr:peptidoglycan DD-metalloendopeptidase family protein [Gemmatimonadota bacterium]